MEKINNAIATLENSPLFNLSLASKELFHSNFLEWLIKTDSMRTVTTALLREFAGGIDLNLDTLQKPKREDNNFDLTLKVQNHSGKQYRIVIENKVKSIPLQEQLNEYSTKLVKSFAGEETVAILLSLAAPDFFLDDRYSPGNGGPVWRYYGYDALLRCLERGRSNDPYHDALLTDYRNFIRGLLGLQTAIHDTFRRYPEALINPFDWPQKKERSLYSQLKEIRMHDIFEKWRMCCLKEDLKKCFESGELDFETGFSRGSGMLNILPKARGDKPFYCVSCQGKQLRQVLVKPDKRAGIFQLAKAGLNKREWFLAQDGTALPECGEAENFYFCRYGDNFAYRYEELADFDRLKKLAGDLLSAPHPR